jgi:ABC-type lipoprotein export system ATPase subunit
MPLLQLDGVHKHYGKMGAHTEVKVLSGLSLQVEPGASVAVIGPSGCGKSTLLNIIGGLDRPNAGTIHFDGQDVASLSDTDLAKLRNRAMGFVFQQHHLLPQCTVWENVLVPTLAQKRSHAERTEDAARARNLLAKVGLADRLDHRPSQLSGGESQRTALVRALIHSPRLLLADEPTGSLDPDTAGELEALLTELQSDQGVAMIVVTHSHELANRMDTVYTLKKGQLTA